MRERGHKVMLTFLLTVVCGNICGENVLDFLFSSPLQVRKSMAAVTALKNQCTSGNQQVTP